MVKGGANHPPLSLGMAGRGLSEPAERLPFPGLDGQSLPNGCQAKGMQGRAAMKAFGGRKRKSSKSRRVGMEVRRRYRVVVMIKEGKEAKAILVMLLLAILVILVLLPAPHGAWIPDRACTCLLSLTHMSAFTHAITNHRVQPAISLIHVAVRHVDDVIGRGGEGRQVHRSASTSAAPAYRAPTRRVPRPYGRKKG